MSSQTYDNLWQEALQELQLCIATETPKDPRLAPKDAKALCCLYARYLQVLRKLEAAYDQLFSPIRRSDLRKVLEACVGHTLEIRQALVQMNNGQPFLNVEPALAELRLSPDALDLILPRFFTDDRKEELERRADLLATQIEAHKEQIAAVRAAQQASGLRITGPVDDATQDEGLTIPSEATQHDAPGCISEEQPPMPLELASSGMERHAEELKGHIFDDPSTGQPRKTRQALTEEEAAIKIQAAARGLFSRTAVQQQLDEELRFLGMKPKDAGEDSAQYVDSRGAEERKTRQGLVQQAYDNQLVMLKQQLDVEEVPMLRDAIQDKINAWFLEKRTAEADIFPELPTEEQGGSNAIPASGTFTSASAQATGRSQTRSRKPVAAPAPTLATTRGAKDAAAVRVDVSKLCLEDLKAALQGLGQKWQPAGRDPEANRQREEEIIKSELRPLVAEQTRLQVDAEMRASLLTLREKFFAEKAELEAKGPKTKKGKDKSKKQAATAKPDATQAATESLKQDGKAGSSARVTKKLPDLTADMPLELVMDRLVESGILQPCPNASLSAFYTSPDLNIQTVASPPATAKQARAPAATPAAPQGKPPPASLSQVKQMIIATCLLPLGSAYLRTRLPAAKAVLLYGCKGTGKTLLAQALASMTGANWFDLSPHNTDGTFTGKDASLMLHMVFKLAKQLGPSVVYIEDIEKVFVTDKKRAAGFGGSEPFNRIKKDLIKEVAALGPNDQVLVVGHSREPQACVRDDWMKIRALFDHLVYLPLPNYTSRRVIWQALMVSRGLDFEHDYELSLLATLSEGYSAGSFSKALDAARGPDDSFDMAAGCSMARQLLDSAFASNGAPPKNLTAAELMGYLSKEMRSSEDEILQLQEWASEGGAEPTEDKMGTKNAAKLSQK